MSNLTIRPQPPAVGKLRNLARIQRRFGTHMRAVFDNRVEFRNGARVYYEDTGVFMWDMMSGMMPVDLDDPEVAAWLTEDA